MKKHKSSWPFLEPVNKDDVPDYYDIITDPIGIYIYIYIYKNIFLDIKNIEKKL